MKKLLFVVVILLLATLAGYFIFFRGKSTLGTAHTKFSLEHSEQVSEVIISADGNELDIYKSGNDWYAENEKLDRQKITNLLMLIENLEILSPVSLSATDSVVRCLDAGKKIQFLSGSKILLEFEICTFNEQLFARKKAGKNMFRVASRGFSGVDLSRLLNTDKNFWKGNQLFSLNPADIRLVNVHYFPENEKDFALYSDAGKIAVKGTNRELEDAEINKEFVGDYLQFFSGIGFEKPTDEKSLIESLQKTMPFFSLQIISTRGEEIKLAGFRLPGENTAGFDPFTFCAIRVSGECIFLKYSEFDPILAELQDFLKK